MWSIDQLLHILEILFNCSIIVVVNQGLSQASFNFTHRNGTINVALITLISVDAATKPIINMTVSACLCYFCRSCRQGTFGSCCCCSLLLFWLQIGHPWLFLKLLLFAADLQIAHSPPCSSSSDLGCSSASLWCFGRSLTNQGYWTAYLLAPNFHRGTHIFAFLFFW